VASSYGFLGTYPPTQCGLATFTRAMMRSLATRESGDTVGVVRVLDTPATSTGPEVVCHLYTHSRISTAHAAAALNSFDVAIIQHDDGIYGGTDGDQLLAVLNQMRVPTVVVAHTVLEWPTPHQEQVLRQIVDASDAVVTMTNAARTRLIRRYDADPATVTVIGHGAIARLGIDISMSPGRRPLILTWGLLRPGKGIEWAIDGLRRLRDLRPAPVYVVAGPTHPRVRMHAGDTYRKRLAQRARMVGVDHRIRFVDSYLDEPALTGLVSRADVILLPYDSQDQVTSGVLVEAVAAGKPVVATAFPHAVELLSGGAGLLVPQYDGAAIGDALHSVLTEPGLATRMAAEAARLTPSLLWPAVAAKYRALATTLLADRALVG
jgi:glycosyltransferase involved in cell wall biosynthesis